MTLSPLIRSGHPGFRRFFPAAITAMLCALPLFVRAAITVSSPTVMEGTASAETITFQINVNPPPAAPLELEFATVSGSAVDGVDYVSQRGSLTVPALQTTVLVTLPTLPDTEVEDDERFALLVWPKGNVPAPALTEVPNAEASLGQRYHWREAEGAVPGTFLFAGRSDAGSKPAVIRKNGASWGMEYVFPDPGGGEYFGHVQTFTGRWLAALDSLPSPGGSPGPTRLNFWERDRVTSGVWTSVNPLLFNGSADRILTIASDGQWLAVAAGGSFPLQSSVRLYELTPKGMPREAGRIPLPANSSILQLTLNGRRLLLFGGTWEAPVISLFEALDDSRTRWRTIFSRTAPGGPVLLDGNRILTGGEGMYHTFEKDAGGPDNWGEVATGPVPRNRFYSVPVMRGNLLLIGETEVDGDGIPGEVTMYVWDERVPGWGAAGSFKAPTPFPRDYFGVRVALSGLDTAVIAGGDERPSWAGSFAGGMATLVNDDLPTINIRRGSALEPAGSGESAFIQVEISRTSSLPVKFNWATSGLTATAGADYTESSGTVTIPAGQWQTALRVPLLPDALTEADETVKVTISGLTNAAPGTVSTELLIRDTRAAVPVVATSVLEGYEGAKAASVNVETWAPGITPAVPWHTASIRRTAGMEGIATPGDDFFETTGVSPTGPNHAGGESQVAVLADDLAENDEDFAVLTDLPPGAVPASFAPRLLVPLQQQPLTSSDGQWAVVADHTQTIEGFQGGVVVIFRRDGNAPGGWVEHARRSAVDFGGTVWSISLLSLRGGSLVFRDARTSEVFLFAADADGPGQWGLVMRLPVVTRVDQLAFDGETLLVCDQGYDTSWPVVIEAFEKGDDGRWAWRQALDTSGLVPQTIQVSVDGSTAAVAGRLSDHSGILRIFEHEPGNGVRWRKITDINLVTNSPWGIKGVRVNRGVIAADAVNGDSPFIRIFRRGNSGAWNLEQSLPVSGLAAMDRGVILVNRELWAATSAAAPVWQKVGNLPATWNVPSLGGGILTGATSIVAGTNTVPAAFIAEPGALARIADAETFTITHNNDFNRDEHLQETRSLSAGVRLKRPVRIPVTIPWHTADGDALAGQDYIPGSGVVTIPPGEMLGTITVGILPDALPELSESFSIVLGEPSFGTVPTAAGIKFIMNASIPVRFPLTTAVLREPESGQVTLTVPVPLSYPVPVDTVFGCRTGAGTGGAADAVFEDVQVTVPAGSAVLPMPVTLLADALNEGTEVLGLQILLPQGYHMDWTGSSVVEVLDAAHPGLTSSVFNVAEGQSLTRAAPGVLTGNTGGYQGVRLVNGPAHGTLTLQPDGSFTYTPRPGFIGTDHFDFQAIESTADLIPPGTPTAWRWLHPLNGTDPGQSVPGFQTNWKAPVFDATAWNTGSGLMGYGLIGAAPALTLDTNIGTPAPGKGYTAYFRHTFAAPANAPAGMTLEMICNDAAIFYLNGAEAGRFEHPGFGDFATAPDTYTLVSESATYEANESAVQTVSLHGTPLSGSNLLALSLHNYSPSSSDLAFRLHSLRLGIWSHPVPVTINVTDGSVPPSPRDDNFTFPAFVPAADSRLLFKGSLYENDELLFPAGTIADPVLEVQTGGNPAGPVTVDAATGYFRMALPAGFFGATQFTYRLRDKDGWSAPATVSVTIAPSSGFEVWLQEQSAAGGGGVLSTGGDGDLDGIPNFLEYLGGTGPESGNFAPPLQCALGSGGVELTFASAFFLVGDGNVLAVQSSSTPGEPASWTVEAAITRFGAPIVPYRPEVTATSDLNSATARWTHRLTIPRVSNSRWYRLHATRGPQWWRVL